MAEEYASSRSEAPTARRLLEARRQGITPRSADLTVFCVLLVAAGTAVFFGAAWLERLRALLVGTWAGQMVWMDSLRAGAALMLPPLLLIFLCQLAAPMLLSGWVFAPAQFEFRLARIALWRGILRPWQWAGVADLVKAVVKLAVLGAALAWLAGHGLSALPLWFAVPAPQSMTAAAAMLVHAGLILAAAVALPAILDALEQWWRHWRQLRMSPAEILAETREAELSPHVLARLRERAAERRAALLEDEA